MTIKTDLALQKLAINYENHTKQDSEHFEDLKVRLDRIEDKLDKWSWKLAGLSASVSFIIAIFVAVFSRLF